MQRVAAYGRYQLPYAYAGEYGTDIVVQDYATGVVYPFGRLTVNIRACSGAVKALCRFHPARRFLLSGERVMIDMIVTRCS